MPTFLGKFYKTDAEAKEARKKWEAKGKKDLADYSDYQAKKAEWAKQDSKGEKLATAKEKKSLKTMAARSQQRKAGNQVKQHTQANKQIKYHKAAGK